MLSQVVSSLDHWLAIYLPVNPPTKKQKKSSTEKLEGSNPVDTVGFDRYMENK